MVGLCSVLGNLARAMIVMLGKVVVATGVLLSFIAVIEVSLLSDIYASYWETTGGVRAVSTLLNPNNFGVYLGACLMLYLVIPGAVWGRLLSAIAIVVGMYLSGSRTAWLAFIVVLIIWLLRFCIGRQVNISRLAFVFLAIFAGVALTLVLYNQSIGVERLQDFTFANIRVEKYLMYLSGFCSEYFYPDFDGARLHLVSESSYFLLINAFGLIGLGCVVMLVCFLYRLRVAWIPFFPYLVLYYVIVGFFENIVNSFPNNQLLLLSLGSVVALRPVFKKLHQVLTCTLVLP